MKKLLKVLICFMLLFGLTTAVYAASGSWSSTYNIRNGNAGYGVLNSRTMNMRNSRQTYAVTITPNQTAGGAVSMRLERNGILGWRSVGNTQNFHQTSRSTRNFSSSNSGNYRFHIWITGRTDTRSTGDIGVSWTDR